MVKHIVMWKLSDVAEGKTRDENAAVIKEELEHLSEIIDGLLAFEIGSNFNPAGFDLVLYSEFTSIEALRAYDVHPEHLKVRSYIHKVISDRSVVDYEVSSSK